MSDRPMPTDLRRVKWLATSEEVNDIRAGSLLRVYGRCVEQATERTYHVALDVRPEDDPSQGHEPVTEGD